LDPIHQVFGLGVFADSEPSSMHNVSIEVTSATEATLTVGPHSGPFPLPKDGSLPLRVLLDHSVIEAFAGGGRAVVTRRVYPGESHVHVFPFGSAPVHVASFEGYALNKATAPSVQELEAVALAAMS
jgi:hypothetical protein